MPSLTWEREKGEAFLIKTEDLIQSHPRYHL